MSKDITAYWSCADEMCEHCHTSGKLAVVKIVDNSEDYKEVWLCPSCVEKLKSALDGLEEEEEQEVEDDYVPWETDNIDGERERRNGIY